MQFTGPNLRTNWNNKQDIGIRELSQYQCRGAEKYTNIRRASPCIFLHLWWCMVVWRQISERRIRCPKTGVPVSSGIRATHYFIAKASHCYDFGHLSTHRGIIVVSPNFRVDIFSGLALPELMVCVHALILYLFRPIVPKTNTSYIFAHL